MDAKEDERTLDYYAALSLDELYLNFSSSPQGLSPAHATTRLASYSSSMMHGKKRNSIPAEFLRHFKNPLVIILLIAAAISAFVGEGVNAIIIGIMVLMSVILEFIQEHDAQDAAEKLKEAVKTQVCVVRDGKIENLNIEDIVPGDIVQLGAGNIVPADCRIISAKDFFVNQSSLTGESFPVEKYAEFHDAASITEMPNLAFFGTSVVSGSASAIVLRIGTSTEFGKISNQLLAGPVDTEFEKGVTSFSNLILKITIFLVLFIFLFNSLAKRDVLESFIFAIAIAVGLTPELLPMIMAVNMSKGSMSMAKKGVIVKRLSSIPNLGSMDVLCTDKTGTLTEDKIALFKYVNLKGKIDEDVLFYSYLNSSYHTGIFNPLDQAVVDFKKIDISKYEKIDEIPFDFSRKRMSVVVRRKDALTLISKGAPEEIVKCSAYYRSGPKRLPLTKEAQKQILSQYHSMSSEGYRVLGVAIKSLKGTRKAYSKDDESSLELIGFLAFLDPPRADVKEVLKEMHQMGITIKILTGDNELVTGKICTDIGLDVKGVLRGSELREMTDEALRIAVEKNTIFSRLSPDQKTRIINALKSNDHVVGYLGDGINDAPSLKNADVGVSVNSAVDVAKESASIVLTHKSLRVLKEGILDGRKTFGNTMKYIMMSLSSNFGNMFSVAGAVLFLPFLPMLPVQILLNNFLYDSSQLTITSDNVDDDLIRKPKRWNMRFIKHFMVTFGLVSSLFDFITFIVLFFVFKAAAPQFQTAWFMESLATQALIIHVIRTKGTPFLDSKASSMLMFSSIGCVIIGWIIPYTPIGRYFGFEPLSLTILAIIACLVLLYLILTEFIKGSFYEKYDY